MQEATQDIQEEGMAFLETVTEKLKQKLAQLYETILDGQKEIDQMQEYFWDNYTEMDEYGYEGNPLMIPEVRKDAVTSSYCMYAFAHHHAICYSPFGIEEIILSPEEIDKPPMEVMIALNIEPSAFDITNSKDYLKRTYGMIEQMQPLYLKYRGTDKLKSYVRKSDTELSDYINSEIKKFKKDGTLDKLQKKWFGQTVELPDKDYIPEK